MKRKRFQQVKQWDKECEDVVKKRKESLKIFNKNKTMQNYETYRKARNEDKKIREKKKGNLIVFKGG